MQTVSSAFTTEMTNNVREISQATFMSFLKTYDPAISFFTINTSEIAGGDVIKAVGAVLTMWDQYDYTDYSSRVVSLEWQRERDEPAGSMVMAMADWTLANSDNLFTPGSDVTIGSYILPNRPTKINVGFSGENVPVFIGTNEKMPQIDLSNGTAQFHGTDFISYINEYPLDNEALFQNKRSDEIIDSLLTTIGLSATQYSLDNGMNNIPFAYFPAGSKVGEIIRQLMEAELGMFYQDELGVLQFANRQRWTLAAYTTSRFTFTRDNCAEITIPTDHNIVNVCEVKGSARAVQAKTLLWTMASPVLVPPSSSVDVFSTFSDDDGDLPVTDVDDPTWVDPLSTTTSSYTTNDQENGSGNPNNGYITVSATALGSTSFLTTFTNSDTHPMYITGLKLYGTPATVVQRVYSRKINQASIDVYKEHAISIENNLIQSQSFADSLASVLTNEKALPEDTREVLVPGLPHLQIGDMVTLDDGAVSQTYTITKIVGTQGSDGMKTRFTLVKKTIVAYFTINISAVGSDAIFY